MKKMKYAVLAVVSSLILAGCNSGAEVQQPVEEIPQEVIEEPKNSVDIAFGGKDFSVPLDFAMYHTSQGMYPVSSDAEELFFTIKGQNSDVCMLRTATLSSSVTRVEDADEVIKKYCDPSYYNAAEIVFDEIGLYDAFYTHVGIATTLEDKTDSVFTLIPRNTNEIYSITFAADHNGTPLCSVEDTKTILNSLQRYSGVDLQDDFFYQIFRQFMDAQSRELYKYRSHTPVPVLVDEAFCDLDADTTYYLGLESGLYSIEALEGEGEITIEDSRFGTRVMLLGYDSANAPIHLPNVTLVHGGGITTNLGLRIRIVK